MSDTEIVISLFDRYAATQSSWGRWRLRLRVFCRRLAWRWVVRGGQCTKRGFDIVASFILLVLFSPLLLLIAALVKLEDGGPVFFVQTRVGKFGRTFQMYKFRSMCRDAERQLQLLLARNHHRQGVTFKLKDDPRITKVGKRLRKYSLDELPQIFNVFIGDMSLVGPRPPVPREVALYSFEDRRRLAAMPGITCFWQVQGRSEIDFSGQVQLDVKYIEQQSLTLDCKILLQTLPAVVSTRGAC